MTEHQRLVEQALERQWMTAARVDAILNAAADDLEESIEWHRQARRLEEAIHE